jgi:hypothetical protein
MGGDLRLFLNYSVKEELLDVVHLFLMSFSVTIVALTIWEIFNGNAKLTWTTNTDSEKFRFHARVTTIQTIHMFLPVRAV